MYIKRTNRTHRRLLGAEHPSRDNFVPHTATAQRRGSLSRIRATVTFLPSTRYRSVLSRELRQLGENCQSSFWEGTKEDAKRSLCVAHAAEERKLCCTDVGRTGPQRTAHGPHYIELSPGAPLQPLTIQRYGAGVI